MIDLTREEIERLRENAAVNNKMVEQVCRGCLAAMDRYRELWCAVWQCPLDEYEDDHAAAVDEARRQCAAEFLLKAEVAELKSHAMDRVKELENGLAEIIASCKTSGRLIGYNSEAVDRAEAVLQKQIEERQ